MSHHLVEVHNLHYHYPDGTAALNGINIRITHGEAVAIIGANGAGKSTLLQHLNGSLLATSGEVRIGEMPVLPETLPQIRRSVGMVFQDPDDQLFMPTVHDDVAFGPANLGFPPAEIEQRVAAALAEVGASHLANKPPYHLSGGEKKRVAIATVLAMSPDVLVMDEPANSLDPCSRRHLIRLLAAFRHTRIIASHDLDLVMELCSRVIVLNGGKIAADGAPLDIFANRELLADCRLEPPLAMQRCPRCASAEP